MLTHNLIAALVLLLAVDSTAAMPMLAGADDGALDTTDASTTQHSPVPSTPTAGKRQMTGSILLPGETAAHMSSLSSSLSSLPSLSAASDSLDSAGSMPTTEKHDDLPKRRPQGVRGLEDGPGQAADPDFWQVLQKDPAEQSKTEDSTAGTQSLTSSVYAAGSPKAPVAERIRRRTRAANYVASWVYPSRKSVGEKPADTSGGSLPNLSAVAATSTTTAASSEPGITPSTQLTAPEPTAQEPPVAKPEPTRAGYQEPRDVEHLKELLQQYTSAREGTLDDKDLDAIKQYRQWADAQAPPVGTFRIPAKQFQTDLKDDYRMYIALRGFFNTRELYMFDEADLKVSDAGKARRDELVKAAREMQAAQNEKVRGRVFDQLVGTIGMGREAYCACVGGCKSLAEERKEAITETPEEAAEMAKLLAESDAYAEAELPGDGWKELMKRVSEMEQGGMDQKAGEGAADSADA